MAGRGDDEGPLGKFMADKEWAAIKKETAAKHGKLVGEIQDRPLKLTAYSPRRPVPR
jgi:hypothetical protein